MKCGFLFFLSLVFATASITAQQVMKDTVYVFFDETHENMKKLKFKYTHNLPYSYVYQIREKETGEEWGDVFFNFFHMNRIKRPDENPPTTIVRYVDFLNKLKLFTTKFFAETDYSDVIQTFEGEGFNTQDVTIFLIDKSEIYNGNMILREVQYSRPVKE